MRLAFFLPGPRFAWRETVKRNGRRERLTKHGRHPAPKNHWRIAKIPGKGGAPGFQKIVLHQRTEAAERALVDALRPLAPAVPLAGALRLDLVSVLPIPASWPAWKREAALAGVVPAIAARKHGDRGNLLKMVEDALEAAGFYADDAAVTSGDVAKCYGPVPGYQITITPRGHGPRSAKKWKAWRS